MSFFLVPVYRRIWALKGTRPEGLFFWSNKKISLFGALIDGKKLFHEWYDGLNSLTYKAFLSSFVEQLPKGKYVFLLDNAPYHKSSVITNYLNNLGEDIKVEFFPPYSPELNPNETCWKIIRNNVTNSVYFKTIEKLMEEVDEFLEKPFFNLNVLNSLCP